mmetsp:Transcript_32968/g.38370  ORF Transcript_32968/g.38370 Transcript_32968/m.38370 type:complete len:438 (-) Transcript_32968:1918-3231(-)
MYTFEGDVVPKDITEATIDASLTTIPKYAFKQCSRLKSIIIPSTVTVIERCAFGYCKSLKSIIIPSSVTIIGENAFRDCTSLATVHFEEQSQLTDIGIAAFRCCISLLYIDLPNSVKKIGFAAFYHCESLLSVTIPTISTCAATSCIASLAASNAAAATSKSSRASLLIYPAAFRGCKSLVSIALPKHVKFIAKCGEFNSERYPYFSICDTLEKRNSTLDHRNNVTTNTINDSTTDITSWVQKRFDHLPLHELCYNPKVTKDEIQTVLQKNKRKDTIEAIDSLGMTPLHILTCNSYSKPEIVQYVLQLYPYASKVQNVNNMIPMQLYLKCHNVNLSSQKNEEGMVRKHRIPGTAKDIKKEEVYHRFTLNQIIQQGMDGDRLEYILALDNKALLELEMQHEDTDLYPFIQAALSVQCSLDVVYVLTRHSIDVMIALVL